MTRELLAEFGYLACERGDSIEKMRRDLAEIFRDPMRPDPIPTPDLLRKEHFEP